MPTSLAPLGKLGLFTYKVLPPLKKRFLRKFIDISNLVLYEKEATGQADIYTCTLPAVSKFLVENGLAQGIFSKFYFFDFAQSYSKKVKTMQNDRIHQTVVVLETTTMSPLSFWVTNTKDNDLGSIIRLELEKAQNQRQKAIRPSNGKLCLGKGHSCYHFL